MENSTNSRIPHDFQHDHREGLINNLEQIQAIIKAISCNIDCLTEAEHFRCLATVNDLAERAKQYVEPTN